MTPDPSPAGDGHLRAWARQKVECPLSTSYREARIQHNECHEGDDWPSTNCGSSHSPAWVAAGVNGRPDCTCGLDKALASLPPAPENDPVTRERRRVLSAINVGMGIDADAIPFEEGSDEVAHTLKLLKSPAPDLGRLRAVVKKWEARLARDKGWTPGQPLTMSADESGMLSDCIDDLSSALDAITEGT